jgi:hypothetical protein
MFAPRREILLVALGAFAFTALVALTTNHVDTTRYHWDFDFYLRMATTGPGGADGVAPFAYRFLPTEIVRAAHAATGVSLPNAFAGLAFVGAALALVALHVLLRRLGAPPPVAALSTLLTGLQLYQVRFLLFDVYRPEPVAYPLLALALLALFAERPAACLGLSALGLMAREFLVLPPLLLALAALVPGWAPWPAPRRRPALAAVSLLVLAAAIVLPRAFLPVARSVQTVDFQHDPHAYHWLTDFPRMHRRDINVVYCLLSYGLPVWVLCARGRLGAAWRDLGPRRVMWTAYVVITLVLTLYGGTDVFRFVAYLFPPVADLLVGLVRRARRVEIAYALVAMAVFNRLCVPIPMDTLAHYLDFYGGWDQRLTPSTLARTLELLAWVLGAVALRRVTRTGRPLAEPPSRFSRRLDPGADPA